MDIEQFAEKTFPPRAAVVTPNDGADVPFVGGLIYVGGAGNVAVQTIGGDTVTFTAVPVGMILPVQVKRVMSTNTTATAIVIMGY